jgi:predicted transcriptional regulator
MEEKNERDAAGASKPTADVYDYSSSHEQMNKPSVDVNKIDDAELKKNKVLDLDCKGYTQVEIAEAVGISQPTVSRYLKEARDTTVESKTEYAKQAIQDLERTKRGHDRALKGIWSIAEDPNAAPADRLRAYSLIVQCNSRRTQTSTTSRLLSQWHDQEEKNRRLKEHNDEWDKFRH